jgi:hypothetical protein
VPEATACMCNAGCTGISSSLASVTTRVRGTSSSPAGSDKATLAACVCDAGYVGPDGERIAYTTQGTWGWTEAWWCPGT